MEELRRTFRNRIGSPHVREIDGYLQVRYAVMVKFDRQEQAEAFNRALKALDTPSPSLGHIKLADTAAEAEQIVENVAKQIYGA